MTAQTGKFSRSTWFNPLLDDYEAYKRDAGEILVPCGASNLKGLEPVTPNLVGSALTVDHQYPTTEWHSPVIDVDFEIRTVPSTTPGHFHLYFDGLRMQWLKYQKFLAALTAAGVIERRFFQHAVRRGMTMVRLPGIEKADREPSVRNDWPEGVAPLSGLI